MVRGISLLMALSDYQVNSCNEDLYCVEEDDESAPPDTELLGCLVVILWEMDHKPVLAAEQLHILGLVEQDLEYLLLNCQYFLFVFASLHPFND